MVGIITQDVGSLKQYLRTEDSKLKSRNPVNKYFLSTNYYVPVTEDMAESETDTVLPWAYSQMQKTDISKQTNNSGGHSALKKFRDLLDL